MSTRLHRLHQISVRFAPKKKPLSSIDKQCAALVELIESEKTQTIEAFVESNGQIKTVEDAYKIQESVSKILESQSDKYQLCGYKIGGTASNIRTIWDISEPFVSPFYNIWHYVNNKAAEKKQGLTIGLESEFIFKIGETLSIENKDKIVLEDIYPLVDCIYPGFELIEPRIIDNESIFNLPIQYLIADLCWTGGIVIGSQSNLSDLRQSSWKQYDRELQDAAVEIYINNEQKGIGYGREVMGSPFNSLLCVYNHLLQKSETVLEGQFISTGTVTGCNFVNVGDVTESVFENIGDVEFKLV